MFFETVRPTDLVSSQAPMHGNSTVEKLGPGPYVLRSLTHLLFGSLQQKFANPCPGVAGSEKN